MRRISSLLVGITLLYSCLPSRAQEAPVPPTVPQRDNPPTPPAPEALGNQPQPAAAPDEMVPALQYPNNPVSDILALYERLTGKVLIRDSSLTGQGAVNISIISTKAMPKQQAIHFIEASLLLNGYTLVPDTENRVKVIFVARKEEGPRSEAVPLYDNAAEIPAGNEIVSYFMPLRFIGSADALAIFKEHVALHSYGVMIEVPNAQALVITENAPLIRELLNLQELVDVPPARVMSEFITLKHADAARVAETISKLIDNEKSEKKHPAANTPAPVPGNLGAAGGGDAGGALYENELVSGAVQLVPDDRTNRILVITRPANFPYIKNLIGEFDEDLGTGTPMECSLKYVSAREVLQTLADALAAGEEQKTGTAGQTASIPQENASRPSSQAQTQGQSYQQPGGTSGAGGPSEPQDILPEPEDEGPTSVIVGKTHLIADNKANSILVIGTPESQEKVRAILDRLDRKPAQVYLSTIIGQLQLTNTNETGVDYLKLFKSPQSTSGNQNGIAASALNTTNALVTPENLTAAAAFPATGGLSLYGTIAKNVSVYVHALESTNRFKVLARPVVYTTNNKKATILSGQRVPYPSSTLSDLVNTGSNSTALQSNITYEDVVLKLEVIPLINANNEVNLKIAQVDDSIAGNQTIAGNTVPTIATQKIVTTVRVRNGEAVVLGGLITENTTSTLTGIPVLMHLPWIGQAFRDTKKSKERDELVIFIQPNVVDNDDQLAAATTNETNRAIVGKNATDFAQPPIGPKTEEKVGPRELKSIFSGDPNP
ncbi:MAG TPA: secretin N-terminal domain-containing protein [Chthoniobacteraceae bacterium]|nr:secretin N-terminal domain-containing protein [Chthoniobacteraceae bacterium]